MKPSWAGIGASRQGEETPDRLAAFGTPRLRRPLKRFAAAGCLVLLGACEPEVGSDAWCEKMADTPKGDWSMNEATEFARSCVLKTYD